MSTNYKITNIIPFVTNTEYHTNVVSKIVYTYTAQKNDAEVSATREIVMDISPEIRGFIEFENLSEEDIHKIIEGHVFDISLKKFLDEEFDKIASQPEQAAFSFQLSTEPSAETVLDKAPDYVLSQKETECIEIFNALKPICTKPIDSTFVMSVHAQMKKNGSTLEEIKNFIVEHKDNIPEPGLYLSISRGDDAHNLIGAIEDVPADVLLVNPDPDAKNYYKV